MASLEHLIRPYQSPAPFGTIIIPSRSTHGTERATLTWGASVSGTALTLEAETTDSPPGTSYHMECCNEGLTEQSRQVNRIRITGSDGESWVDVERPYQMSLKRRTKTQCDGPLDQTSLVSQGINAVLNDFEDHFVEAASKFKPTEGKCKTTWNLSK